MKNEATEPRPGEGLDTRKMPGHWVLARMGKRVLRPGGMELTRRMLESLDVRPSDDVVEFAPGLGVTARQTLSLTPASYTAVERDEAAAKIVEGYLGGDRQRVVVGSADATGLPDASATVVYGEAMLTMQTPEMKRRIVGEARRLLRAGGRYAVHEMCLTRDDIGADVREEIQRALAGVVHHGVKPLTPAEWRSLLESEGFDVRSSSTAPMALLEPARLVRDEGLAGALRFFWNVLRDREGRQRVLAMRGVFRRYQEQLAAITLTGVKR